MRNSLRCHLLLFALSTIYIGLCYQQLDKLDKPIPSFFVEENAPVLDDSKSSSPVVLDHHNNILDYSVIDPITRSFPKTKNNKTWVTVEPTDYIVKTTRRDWNTGPVIIESHKLIFFTVQKVGCTIWKQLFRRMMGWEDWKDPLPKHDRHTGLIRPSRHNLSQATYMINSPEYTRAIFLRDPKEKFLSAFLDKAINSNGGKYVMNHCCKRGKGRAECRDSKFQLFSGFVNLTRKCKDPHWGPQSERLEKKYIPALDFIGHLETVEEDARILLERIGAWDKFGASGWGKYGNESIFQSTSGLDHATSNGTKESRDRLSKYYTPEIEKEIDDRMAGDYEIPEYNLMKKKIVFE
jgi:hypothetical protein